MKATNQTGVPQNIDFDDDAKDDKNAHERKNIVKGKHKPKNIDFSDVTTQPNETPEEQQSKNEGTGYSNQTEVEQQQSGNDASYSEQNDVNPPRPHEFPSIGNAKTDFASRPQGRTTARMIGHEPGTEGI